MGPLRRVIPVGYQVWKLRLDGQSPLLMNSSEYDRKSDTYRAFKQLGSKRGKTVDDEGRLSELEFYLSLHHDKTIGVFVPGLNVKELLRSAATKYRKGEEVRRSLIVPDYRIPVIYDGPKEPSKLWEEGFYDTRMVANAGAGSGRVPRTRAKFDPWAVECEVAFDPEDLDPDLLESVVDRSTRYGFGDGRTIGFGAFSPDFVFIHVQREDSEATATKGIDPSVVRNLTAADKRIKPASKRKAA